MAQANTVKLKATINKSGEAVYEAPIEIRDKADLANYGITWEDCKTLRFGTSDRITVYFFRTTNRKLAEEQWRYLNSQHSKGYRSTRCLVPGTQNPLIVCPDGNKCSACPYGLRPEDRQSRIISWEGMAEEGCELAGSEMTDAGMELDEIRKRMDQKNPNIMKAVTLKELYGFTVPEIADILGITNRNVYFYLSRAREIGEEYRKEG